MFPAYLHALKRELAVLAKEWQSKTLLKTVFFGGGTPTVLPADYLVELLGYCRELFRFEDKSEISIEANPGTVMQQKLSKLKKAGFNRLSIGVQSFVVDELQKLGRAHTPEEAIRCFEMARSAGFTNVSLDLMYGLTGQTVGSWRKSLDCAIELAPEHLSMYQLTIEEKTPYGERFAKGDLDLPDDDQILAIDELNLDICKKAGLDMYEVSNYARKGFRCAHNINYWCNEEYLAAGAAAVSYMQGKRQRRCDDPATYCDMMEKGKSCIVESEELSPEASFRETVIMGLRMTDGVQRNRLITRYGIDPGEYYKTILVALQDNGLVELTDSYLRLTGKGRLLSNSILAELV